MSVQFCAVFPGQGSQHPGMGKEIYDNFNSAKRIYEEASDAIKLDLKRLCFEGSEADLRLTANTQPALLVTSLAAWRVFCDETAFRPVVAMGHSLGEYTALCAAQALPLSFAVQAVRLRGQAMQEAVPVGTGAMMAVLGMDDEAVTRAVSDLLHRAQTEAGLRGSVLEAANFNCPGQVALSGHSNALEFFKTHLVPSNYGASKTKMIPLAVSAPFHSSLMRPAAEKLKPFLEKIPWTDVFDFDIVHNVNGQKNRSSTHVVDLLYQQMTKPVLWTSSVRHCLQNVFVEFGAGRVLSGLIKKTLPEPTTLNVDTVENLKATQQKLEELSS
ncbi:MAG: ACP S-malonyltransferase [Oligoflexia bacterium]|nr:ACP S-malonyltransferase [Oligoflexia bacterium]